MNKIIKLSLIFVILIGAIIGTLVYLTSVKSIDFKVARDDVKVEILRSDSNDVLKSFTGSQSVRLSKGDYFYRVISSRYSDESIKFTVDESKTININPVLSVDEIRNIYNREKEAIYNLLTVVYPQVSGYIIADEKIHGEGDWYSAKLMEKVSPRDTPEVYRLILNKSAGNWEVAVTPRPIISITEFPDIPADFIRAVNESPSNDAYSLVFPE
ncbi:hypothetical protein B7Z17_00610 [Candidatus Saccharibacteria bacterium 32-49-10]|nr:MAG: hypothetical protein B7Z17_00610 [Candidatus Saccharibacteria bacterium 32-49-10]